MCGIAGFVPSSTSPALAPPSLDVARAMLAQIHHRGPDEFGIYIDDHVAMGNARLSIVDLAGGTQPISNETGDLWIVYNGEVFNYPELRELMEARGHLFSTHTDTEVILHLYEEFGADCLSRLNGQFAIAIWDSRTQKLFLARDRLGVRPLFYTFLAGTFIFGSEIKCVLAHPGTERALDPDGIRQVFSYWSPLSPRTSFKGIREIPPGHFAVLEAGKLTLQQFWCLEFPDASETERPVSEQTIRSLKDELRSLLVDATRVRLRADVPVGAYLSGGLDSSVIAATIRHIGTSRLDTFSIAFSDPEFDESAAQVEMAKFLGTEHQVVRATHADIARHFPEAIWHAETPLTRSAPVPMFLLSRLVNERKYKVVLTGEGADEFLAGYDIFKESKIRQFWAREPGSKRRPRLLQRLYPEIARLGASAPGFQSAFFGKDLEMTSAPDYSHRIRWANNRRTHRFFSQSFAESLGSGSQGLPEVTYPAGFDRWGPLQRAQYLEASLFLSGYLLSSQGDRMAMANAVEGRYPFLDYRVVRFCNTLPSSVKLRALNEKWLLRETFKEWLPPGIARRRKRPYRAPIYRCFAGEGAPDYARELFAEDSLARTGIFEPKAAAGLFRSVQLGRALGETDEMALLGILSTELLHHQFIAEFDRNRRHEASERVKLVDRRGDSRR